MVAWSIQKQRNYHQNLNREFHQSIDWWWKWNSLLNSMDPRDHIFFRKACPPRAKWFVEPEGFPKGQTVRFGSGFMPPLFHEGYFRILEFISKTEFWDLEYIFEENYSCLHGEMQKIIVNGKGFLATPSMPPVYWLVVWACRLTLNFISRKIQERCITWKRRRVLYW